MGGEKLRLKLNSAQLALEAWAELGIKQRRQAGAELGQAQLKLGLDFSVDLVTLDLIC